MKTRIFSFVAALLLSVCAFAQSENNEPLKGDVNNDGTVDVADIVNVIKIMQDGGGAVGEKMYYWYVGTNNGSSVQSDNFTDVASRIPESEIPETGSFTADGDYVYFVIPDTKQLESLVDGGGSAIEFSCTDAMGYHIYATVGKINGQINYSVEQTVYYWYAGQAQPVSIGGKPTVDDTNFTNNKWHTLNTDQINQTITGGTAGNPWYIAVPSIKSFEHYASDMAERDTSRDKITTITINSISYDVWKTYSTGAKTNVYMK